MFAGPRAAAALKRRGSATSVDDQCDVDDDAPKLKARRVKTMVGEVASGPGERVVNAAREQEKAKARAVRLATTARRTIQEMNAKNIRY